MEVWPNILKQWLLLLIILEDIYFLALVINLAAYWACEKRVCASLKN